jgi:hypothetical protein
MNDNLLPLHTALTAIIMSPMRTTRLENVEEILNDARNAAAVGTAPPPGLADAIPPDRLADIIRKLPARERRQAAELLAEPPVRRIIKIHLRP